MPESDISKLAQKQGLLLIGIIRHAKTEKQLDIAFEQLQIFKEYRCQTICALSSFAINDALSYLASKALALHECEMESKNLTLGTLSNDWISFFEDGLKNANETQLSKLCTIDSWYNKHKEALRTIASTKYIIEHGQNLAALLRAARNTEDIYSVKILTNEYQNVVGICLGENEYITVELFEAIATYREDMSSDARNFYYNCIDEFRQNVSSVGYWLDCYKAYTP